MMLPAESWYSPGTKYQECTADRFFRCVGICFVSLRILFENTDESL